MNAPMRALWVLALVACQRSNDAPPPTGHNAPPIVAPKTDRPVPPLPDPLPGKRRDMTAIVGRAARAAIGDLDGDGKPELVLVDSEQLRVVDLDGKELAHAPAQGGIEVLAIVDRAIVAGWGLSREHRDAKAKVTLHRFAHGTLTDETVLAPATVRQDVVAVLPLGGDLGIAYFDTKYTVAYVVAHHTDAGWTAGPPTSIRMATAWARGDLDGSGKPQTIVGRLYGDTKDADGDAFVLGADGTRTKLPTTRGVQGLAIADTDGDGKAEIYVGDGWDANYGQIARGLLTEIRDGKATLIEDTPGQFTIWQIVVADVDGDGKPDLVTRGSHYVRVYRRDGGAWHGQTIAGAARDVAVGPDKQILVLGDKPELVDLTQPGPR